MLPVPARSERAFELTPGAHPARPSSYSIPVYNFPYDVEEDDDETIAENAALRASLPFAIVGSEEEVETDGELIRVRRCVSFCPLADARAKIGTTDPSWQVPARSSRVSAGPPLIRRLSPSAHPSFVCSLPSLPHQDRQPGPHRLWQAPVGPVRLAPDRVQGDHSRLRASPRLSLCIRSPILLDWRC